MLKEYLSEGVSLLTEAMFGAPVKAKANHCACVLKHTPYDCVYACNTSGCGAGKRLIKENWCCTGCCDCIGGICRWC